MDIDVLRKLARISADTVSCFYVEQVPGMKNKELKARIEKTFVGRQWKPSGAMDTLNLLTGGGTNPLQSVANAFDQWAKGTSPPPAPAPVQTPPTASPSQPGSNIPVPSTVEVRSPEDWAEQFDTFSGDLDLFLTMISAVGFLIAVLSILNTMLMSVMERIGEFGILRAMGWTRGEVMRLVMSESAVIGLVGGIVGVIFGTAASAVANQVWPDRLSLHVSLGLALFAFLMSTLLGVAGGLYPAWKAARLSPMDAIRRA